MTMAGCVTSGIKLWDINLLRAYSHGAVQLWLIATINAKRCVICVILAAKPRHFAAVSQH